jgi:hypothetical protein
MFDLVQSGAEVQVRVHGLPGKTVQTNLSRYENHVSGEDKD